MNAPVKTKNIIGEYIKDDNDIRFCAFETLSDAQIKNEESNTLVLFVDRNRKIVAVENLGNVKADEINAAEITKSALKNDSSEIFIAYKAPAFTDEEWEIYRYQHSVDRVSYRLQKKDEIKAFVQLATDINKQGITLGDVHVYGTHSSLRYSDNVSTALFPAFGIELHDYLHRNNTTFGDNNNVLFEKIKNNNRHGYGENAVENVHAIFLDNKEQVLSQYKVPVDNVTLIPGLLDERKCVFEPIFKQALKESADSIVLVRNYNSHKTLVSPDSEDVDILHDARNKAKQYGVSLKDYIVLGSYAEKSDEYKKISFVETYGMK